MNELISELNSMKTNDFWNQFIETLNVSPVVQHVVHVFRACVHFIWIVFLTEIQIYF